jgi:predicted ATPase/DNA-binding CsgD family transcriptional regulator
MTAGGRTRDRPGRLPTEVTSLVGRRRDVAEVRRLLAGARLVTLTGTGGSGKSRLAVRVATELRRAFTGGVWLVDLAPVTDPALLPYAVAEALGLTVPADRPVAELLPEHVRDRELLLVLDNCEHLTDACATFADRVLRAGAGVRVLCTSRHVLGMAAEHVWDVTPLAVPGPEVPYTPGVESRYPGVALFAERAAAVQPGFVLGPGTWPTVTEICRQLDGLPLAIELAAARLRTHSPGQLAAGLYHQLGTRHAVPARHRRLDSAFEWSFALCSPGEQLLWQRLSVFTDTFDLDAAEYVFEDDALELAAGLIEKSVLCRESPVDGPPRYRLLETVRRYGLDRLRATYGEAEERRLRDRHRDWCLDLAERFDADWFGPRQAEWVARMRAEYPNIRAALDGSVGTPRLRLATALRFYWYACGAGNEGRYWLERALADDGPDPVRARAWQSYTMLVQSAGDRAAAEHGARELIALADKLDDPVWRARATGTLGCSQLLADDLTGGMRTLETALAALDGLPVTDYIDVTIPVALAFAVYHAGDHDRAAALCARAREVCAAAGDRWWLAHVLVGSALAAWGQGRMGEATGYLRESLVIRRELDDPLGVGGAIERLAWLAAAEGDHERAARLLGAGERMWQAVGRHLFGAALWLRGREKCTRACREALGEARFAALVARGREMATDEAIRYTLDEAVPERTGAGTDADAARLTPRERQVAELIATGLSNHQIATRLVTSPRTAESHVQNILRKLGFGSRAQVAAWVARQSRD